MKYSIMRSFQAAMILVLLLAWGQATAQAIVSTAEKQPYGAYLVDAAGDTSLYLFKADKRGKRSTCYGACAKVWLPMITQGKPQAQVRKSADNALLGTIEKKNGSMQVTYGDISQAKEKVHKALLGTIERKNGSMQVTYDGWPLYYYFKDTGPGDTQGEGIESFGAKWYLVTPHGKPIYPDRQRQEKQ
ncbi:MAG: COG4315 family predicted lipoprotein [Candidatus Nitrosoglobus sp.]|jgi:predicted lipoprotein with Yx(FWY)xxD motif